MQITAGFHALGYWFAERDIPTDGLTVILNFKEAHAAAKFDAFLKKEIGESMCFLAIAGIPDNLCGIQFKIESPLHPHGMK